MRHRQTMMKNANMELSTAVELLQQREGEQVRKYAALASENEELKVRAAQKDQSHRAVKNLLAQKEAEFARALEEKSKSNDLDQKQWEKKYAFAQEEAMQSKQSAQYHAARVEQYEGEMVSLRSKCDALAEVKSAMSTREEELATAMEKTQQEKQRLLSELSIKGEYIESLQLGMQNMEQESKKDKDSLASLESDLVEIAEENSELNRKRAWLEKELAEYKEGSISQSYSEEDVEKMVQTRTRILEEELAQIQRKLVESADPVLLSKSRADLADKEATIEQLSLTLEEHRQIAKTHDVTYENERKEWQNQIILLQEKCSVHEQELFQKKQGIIDLTKTIENERSQSSSQARDYASNLQVIHLKNSKLTEEIDNISRQLEIVNPERERLSHKVARLMEDFQIKEKENEHLRDQLACAQNSMVEDSLGRENRELKDELERANQMMKDKLAKETECVSQLNVVKGECTMLCSNIREMERMQEFRERDYADKLQHLESALSESKTVFSKYEQEWAEANGQLKEELAQKKQEICSFKAGEKERIEQSNGYIEELTGRCHEIERDREQLRCALEEERATRGRVAEEHEERIRKLVSENNGKQAQVQHLEKSLSESKTVFSKYEQEWAEANGQLKEELAQRKQEICSFKAGEKERIEQSNGYIEELTGRCHEIERDREQLRCALEEERATRGRVAEEHEERIATLTALFDQKMKGKMAEIEEAKNSSIALSAVVKQNALVAEEALRAEAEAAKNESKEYTRRAKVLEAQMFLLQQKQEEREEEITDMLNSERKKMNDMVTDLVHATGKLKQRLRAMEAEIENKTKEVEQGKRLSMILVEEKEREIRTEIRGDYSDLILKLTRQFEHHKRENESLRKELELRDKVIVRAECIDKTVEVSKEEEDLHCIPAFPPPSSPPPKSSGNIMQPVTTPIFSKPAFVTDEADSRERHFDTHEPRALPFTPICLKNAANSMKLKITELAMQLAIEKRQRLCLEQEVSSLHTSYRRELSEAKTRIAKVVQENDRIRLGQVEMSSLPGGTNTALDSSLDLPGACDSRASTGLDDSGSTTLMFTTKQKTLERLDISEETYFADSEPFNRDGPKTDSSVAKSNLLLGRSDQCDNLNVGGSMDISVISNSDIDSPVLRPSSPGMPPPPPPSPSINAESICNSLTNVIGADADHTADQGFFTTSLDKKEVGLMQSESLQEKITEDLQDETVSSPKESRGSSPRLHKSLIEFEVDWTPKTSRGSSRSNSFSLPSDELIRTDSLVCEAPVNLKKNEKVEDKLRSAAAKVVNDVKKTQQINSSVISQNWFVRNIVTPVAKTFSPRLGDAKEASMGKKNDFYYNKDLKRWVTRGQEGAIENNPAEAPPPTGDIPGLVADAPADPPSSVESHENNGVSPMTKTIHSRGSAHGRNFSRGRMSSRYVNVFATTNSIGGSEANSQGSLLPEASGNTVFGPPGVGASAPSLFLPNSPRSSASAGSPGGMFNPGFLQRSISAPAATTSTPAAMFNPGSASSEGKVAEKSDMPTVLEKEENAEVSVSEFAEPVTLPVGNDEPNIPAVPNLQKASPPKISEEAQKVSLRNVGDVEVCESELTELVILPPGNDEPNIAAVPTLQKPSPPKVSKISEETQEEIVGKIGKWKSEYKKTGEIPKKMKRFCKQRNISRIVARKLLKAKDVQSVFSPLPAPMLLQTSELHVSKASESTQAAGSFEGPTLVIAPIAAGREPAHEDCLVDAQIHFPLDFTPVTSKQVENGRSADSILEEPSSDIVVRRDSLEDMLFVEDSVDYDEAGSDMYADISLDDLGVVEDFGDEPYPPLLNQKTMKSESAQYSQDLPVQARENSTAASKDGLENSDPSAGAINAGITTQAELPVCTEDHGFGVLTSCEVRNDKEEPEDQPTEPSSLQLAVAIPSVSDIFEEIMEKLELESDMQKFEEDNFQALTIESLPPTSSPSNDYDNQADITFHSTAKFAGEVSFGTDTGRTFDSEESGTSECIHAMAQTVLRVLEKNARNVMGYADSVVGEIGDLQYARPSWVDLENMPTSLSTSLAVKESDDGEDLSKNVTLAVVCEKLKSATVEFSESAAVASTALLSQPQYDHIVATTERAAEDFCAGVRTEFRRLVDEISESRAFIKQLEKLLAAEMERKTDNGGADFRTNGQAFHNVRGEELKEAERQLRLLEERDRSRLLQLATMKRHLQDQMKEVKAMIDRDRR